MPDGQAKTSEGTSEVRSVTGRAARTGRAEVSRISDGLVPTAGFYLALCVTFTKVGACPFQ
jgi:hypothetical protein